MFVVNKFKQLHHFQKYLDLRGHRGNLEEFVENCHMRKGCQRLRAFRKTHPFIFFGVPTAATTAGSWVGYYFLWYLPALRKLTRPYPPKRSTPLFVAGSEDLSVFLDDAAGLRFYLHVVWRMAVFFVRTAPLVFDVVYSLFRHFTSPEAKEVFLRKRLENEERERHAEAMVAEVPPPTVGTLTASGNEGALPQALSHAPPQSRRKVLQDAVVVLMEKFEPPTGTYDRLLRLLQDMGPTYVKLGQWIATRPDVFPPAMCRTFHQLYDQAPPHTWEYTRGVLVRHGLFAQLDEIETVPINSGSIAQIHRGVLKADAVVDSPVVRPVGTPAPLRLSHAGSYWGVRFFEWTIEKLGLQPDVTIPNEAVTVKKGTTVAIKILHPNVRRTMLADVAVMRFIAWLVTQLPGAEFLSLEQSAREFAALLLSQVDLRREVDNLLQFRHNFWTPSQPAEMEWPSEPGRPPYIRPTTNSIVFPTPLPSLARHDVIVETFEAGLNMEKAVPSDPTVKPLVAGVHARELANVGCNMFLKMLFEDNFVHADLHPGNLLVRYCDATGKISTEPVETAAEAASFKWVEGLPSWAQPPRKRAPGSVTPQFVVLDPGLVTSLSATERCNFIALFSCVAVGDGELGAQLMMSRSPHQECTDVEKFRKDMKKIFDVVAPGTRGMSLAYIDIGKVLTDIMEAMRQHKVRIDGNFATLVATVIVGEGLGRKLQPDYNFITESVPYLMTCLKAHELRYMIDTLKRHYSPTVLLQKYRSQKSEGNDAAKRAA